MRKTAPSSVQNACAVETTPRPLREENGESFYSAYVENYSVHKLYISNRAAYMYVVGQG